MVKNPNRQEADHLASGQSGTWTQDLRISSPAP